MDTKPGRRFQSASSADSSGASGSLAPWQERLLCRSFDQECGLLSELYARLLLCSSARARSFQQQLERTRAYCRTCSAEVNDDLAADLWSRIDQRIVAEERAALFLGERTPPEIKPLSSLFEHFRRSVPQLVVGTCSGAVVAVAVVALFGAPRFSEPRQPVPVVDALQLASASLGGGDPFGGTDVKGFASPLAAPVARLASSRGQVSQVQVDWMRANGPLTFIHNPQGSSAIIWVKRRSSNGSSSLLRERMVPAGEHATPSFVADANNTGVGEPGLARGPARSIAAELATIR